MYPNKTQRPKGPTRLRDVSRLWQKAANVSNLWNYMILSTSFCRKTVAFTHVAQTTHYLSFGTGGSSHEHLWHKDKLKKRGGKKWYRSRRGGLIYSQDIVPFISLEVANDYWPSRLSSAHAASSVQQPPIWQSAKHNRHRPLIYHLQTSSNVTQKPPPFASLRRFRCCESK